MAARTGLEPGQRVDSYEIVRELGAGASGSVYEAKHAFLGRRVALKCLHTHHVARLDVRERMRREAIALSQIRHANVVTVWDAGMLDSGLVWIAMDLLDGHTLRAKLAGDRPLPLAQALYVAAECADGVEAAHEVDVIHRDLKPENIFITHKNEVKVLDLGTAKFIGYGFQTTELNKVPGTVAYMSPEHIGGELVSARSDIYALGLILYEMLAGHHAFARGSNANMPNRYELGALHQFTQPRPLLEFVPGVSKELASIVERSICKRPEERIQSMREFAVLLREERSRAVELERSARRASKDEFATEWKPLDRAADDPRDRHAPQTPATTRREGTVPRPVSLRPGEPSSAERRARLEVPHAEDTQAGAPRVTPAPPAPAVRRSAEHVNELPLEPEPTTQDDRPRRSVPVAEPSVRSLRPPDGRPDGPGIRSARAPQGAARSPEPTPPPVSHESGPGPQSFMGRLGRRSPLFLLFVGLAVSAPAVIGMAALSSFLKGRAAGEEAVGSAVASPSPRSGQTEAAQTVSAGAAVASLAVPDAGLAPSGAPSATDKSATVVSSPPEVPPTATVAQRSEPAAKRPRHRRSRPATPRPPKTTETPDPKSTPVLPNSGL